MSASDRIRSFAARIESVDEEIKARNADKKEIYAEMKGEGFDVKAFKAAHRRYLAHTQNSVTAQEGEALTDLYFVALQGAEGAESPPAAKFGAANGLPEKPSRARARETQSQPPSSPEAVERDGGLDASLGAPVTPIPEHLLTVPDSQPADQAAGVEPRIPPAADLSMDIPAFLRRSKQMETA